VAICSVTACAALAFAGLAFTHGGAQISFRELNISLPSQSSGMPSPEVLPSQPIVAPPSQLAIPYLGIWYRETTANPSHARRLLDPGIFSRDGRYRFTVDRSDQPPTLDLCGARVMAVRPDSPAERVGLQTGDVIVGVDDRGFVDGLDLRSRIRGANVGQQVTLHLYRDDRLIHVPVELGTLPLGEE
jgi:S1-C subfamily serine protease